MINDKDDEADTASQVNVSFQVQQVCNKPTTLNSDSGNSLKKKRKHEELSRLLY